MSTEKTKSVAKNNTVHIVGYLKENNLELVKNKKGEEVIRGAIIVATSEIESHKIQFYIPKIDRNGQESKDFTRLSELLPEKTISIASFLKANESANYLSASQAASKVWVMAHFEEFASRVGERERSIITLKGFRAGFKQDTTESPFVPCADFTVDVYVNSIEKEADTEGKETGRLLLEGIMPLYNGSAYKMTFVAPVEENVASFISGNYAVGDTVTLKGDVVSIQQKVKKSAEDDEFFGRGNDIQYETKFIRERRIAGGSKTPIKQGEEGSFLLEDIKAALAERTIKMDENGKRPRKTDAKATSEAPVDTEEAAPAPAPKGKVDDFEF